MGSLRPKQNRLSYWFPILKDAGLPVPQTQIVDMSQAAQDEIWNAFDGRPSSGVAFDDFIKHLTQVSESFQSPFFLRADETSAKHYWNETCYVEDNRKLASHVYQIAEFCACADMIGLPFDTWAIREFLPTTPSFYAFAGEMPVTEEWRVFVDGNQFLCVHPYWPEDAIQKPSVENWKERLADLYRIGAHAQVLYLACMAGQALRGKWSVDVLKTERGYYITDVALARMSWHDESCANNFTEHDIPDWQGTGNVEG